MQFLRDLHTKAKPLVAHGLNAVFPPRCPSCKESVSAQGTLCAECWSRLHFITDPVCAKCGHPFEYAIAEGALCGRCIADEPPYESARAVLRYDEHSSREVVGFKFYDRTQLAPMFGQWMKRSGEKLFRDADYIIPVPLHRWRLLKRRYNQAALLAYAVAKYVNIPVIPDGLLRVRNTPQQSGLTRSQRLTNLQGAFAVKQERAELFRDKKLLLIDDVMTTGATLNACTKALLGAGAEKIHVLTLARTVLGD